jgi:catechol 2,3-dioxygenase-like lactoylglutathione lyase family enzyme
MPSNDRPLLIGVIAVVTLAAVGAAVHLVPWLRDNRTDISLILLMLLLVASGFTAALALIIPYADRPPPADELDSDNADIRWRGANDLAQSADFYCKVLGLRVSDRIRVPMGAFALDLIFLHANPRHHSIALVAAPFPKRINHFMVEVNSIDDVGLAYDRCHDSAVPIARTLGRHPNDRMFSFYAQTPSGFDVEFGWGGRQVATWLVKPNPTTTCHSFTPICSTWATKRLAIWMRDWSYSLIGRSRFAKG